ncbi:alpha/beta fold hydrolase [Cohnella zeiphila]|uniref:Alpha/beta hydrolase n=1 Tax=Cohnella zeiphila TaxID=2761120 RepID=A0A7X0SLF2_9BACL|nr:alpha/beta hydrolase [Cohnella zeiphila]MBB6732170.1 alpha/beta hydrolase [Cohnella zeiphila]
MNNVISRDGTGIGYRQLGNGPGLVILHGAMESSRSHLQLAEELADSFRVYLPDRRGRGGSGPYGKDHGIRKDVEDLEAILAQTGARFVFGVSSGAIIALRAAMELPAIQKAAIFEPPLSVNGSVSTDFMPRFRKEIAEGNVSSALVTGMKGAQMGPPIFNSLPRWLLKRLTEMMMASEDKKAQDGDDTFRKLAPTLDYDFRLVEEMSDSLDRFKAMPSETLLLGGGKSPAYLKTALDALEKILPHVRRVEFPGLGHGASGNADRGGRPERVAPELRRFFNSPGA